MTGSKSIMSSADELIREALEDEPTLDVNSLHSKTYILMVEHKSKYYERRVDEVLNQRTRLLSRVQPEGNTQSNGKSGVANGLAVN